MEDAEAVDLALHEAIIDHLDNEIISNAYRVNWIKIKLIRLAETRLYVTMIPQVMRRAPEDHRGDRAPRRGRRRRARWPTTSALPASGRSSI